MKLTPRNHIICQNLFKEILQKTPLNVLLSPEFDTSFGAYTLTNIKQDFISSISKIGFENHYKVPGYKYHIKLLVFNENTVYVYIKESGHFQTIEEYCLPDEFFKDYYHLEPTILAEIKKALA